jgi:exopolysaccharide production protein ExoY
MRAASAPIHRSPDHIVGAMVPTWRHEHLIRVLDVVAALALIILFLPVMVLVGLAVKCSSPGFAIFSQERIGRGGRLFSCLKFRSMAPDADRRLIALLATDPLTGAEWARQQKLKRDPRVTRVGAFLRKTSLDELPQLFNVLRGDMSMVGPRPIVAAEIFRYRRYIRDYCSVPPGLTGLWQINGRNNVSYRRRVALDVSYVRARSLRLNLYILMMTVPRVLFAEGTY